jgi:hypothetical protein
MGKQKKRKLLVTKKIYEDLEKYATAKGLTVEEYVHKLVETNDLSQMTLAH